MTPTLAQCRELERLYPGQWEHTKQMWVVHFGAGDDDAYVINASDWVYQMIHKGAQFICAAPSLGEMVRVCNELGFIDTDCETRRNRYTYKIGMDIIQGKDEPMSIGFGDTPEQALAAALIAAGGGESQHRESPEGGG